MWRNTSWPLGRQTLRVLCSVVRDSQLFCICPICSPLEFLAYLTLCWSIFKARTNFLMSNLNSSLCPLMAVSVCTPGCFRLSGMGSGEEHQLQNLKEQGSDPDLTSLPYNPGQPSYSSVSSSIQKGNKGSHLTHED